MAEFRCKRFPKGIAHVRTRLGIVDFTDGEAVVDDPDLAQALREVPAVFQISEIGGEPRSDDRESRHTTVVTSHGAAEMRQPGPRDSKAEWVDWAVHNGADRTEADAMTKKDLIATFG